MSSQHNVFTGWLVDRLQLKVLSSEIMVEWYVLTWPIFDAIGDTPFGSFKVDIWLIDYF